MKASDQIRVVTEFVEELHDYVFPQCNHKSY